MAEREIYRVEIPIIVDDQTDKPLQQAERKISRFEQSVQKTNERIRRLFGREIKLQIGAVDRVLPVVRNIQSNLKGLTSRTWNIILQTKDKASGIISRITGGVKRAVGLLTSPLTLLGVGGGIGGLTKLGIDMVVERENITTAFETLLGSAEAAKQRIEELTEFAGQTPFMRDEIYEASRILEVFTRGALSTSKGLKLVGDVAAGTGQEYKDVALWIGRLYDAMESGRPVGEMTSRLQEMGAISGEQRALLEDLAKSGKDISQTWPQAEKVFARFEGQMESMSAGLGNLLTSVKSFFRETILLRWGQGIESELRPLLERFRQWRREHPEQVKAIGDKIERIARTGMRRIVDFVTKGYGRLKKFWASISADPAFQKLDFGDKIIYILNLALDEVSAWLDSEGGKKLQETFTKLGEIGAKAWIAGLKGAFKGAVSSAAHGNLVGAGAMLGLASMLGGGLVLRGAWGLGKGLFGAGKWALGKLGLGSAGVTAAGVAAETAATAGKVGIASRALPILGRARPWLGRVGLPVVAGLEAINIARAEDKRTAVISGAGRIAGMIAGGKAGAAAGGAIGGLFGGVGAAPGAAIGGILGGIAGLFGGEMIAEKINAWLDKVDFKALKEKALLMWDDVRQKASDTWENVTAWASGAWEEVKESASNAWNWIKENFTLESIAEKAGYVVGYLESTIFSSEWWGGQWDKVKNWASEKWASMVEVYESAKATIMSTIFSSEWWQGHWQSVKDWTSEKWAGMVEIWENTKESLSNTLFNSEWWLDKWGNVKSWTSEKWDEMKTVWENAKEAISSTLFSKDWWAGQWESVKNWASSALSGITARWESIKESFQAGREAGQKVAATKHAIGGILTRPHLGLVAEAGPEAIIPLSARMRDRAMDLWLETGRRLGVRPYAEGGLVGTITEGWREKIPVSSVPSLAVPGPATINLNFDLTGLVGQVVIESREDIDGAVDRIADAIANNLRSVFQNMTK